jgi:DNA-binding transcriptional ArsR family regulator
VRDIDCDGRNARGYRRVARMMGALSSESRLILIDRLSVRERCLCELAEIVGLDQSTVSRHMSKLESCGLISRERRGQHVYFRLSAPWVRELIESRLAEVDREEENGGRQI